MPNLSTERFFKDKNLPFLECRYTRNSGKHYKSHLHNTFSIGAIDAGEVLYTVANKSASLKLNSLAIINPEVLHSCNPLEKKDRSYYMLYIDTSWALKIQQSLFDTESFINASVIFLNDEKIYESYINTMNFFMGDGYLLEKEQMMVELLIVIFPKITKDKSFTCKAFSKDVEKLKKILSVNFEEDLTLDMVSKLLHVNPYTLLRHFKDEVGITPHAFRMNARVEFAKKLLQDKENISQVALDCGFFDQSHFHKHFKSITTVTPKEYQLNFIQ